MTEYESSPEAVEHDRRTRSGIPLWLSQVRQFCSRISLGSRAVTPSQSTSSLTASSRSRSHTTDGTRAPQPPFLVVADSVTLARRRRRDRLIGPSQNPSSSSSDGSSSTRISMGSMRRIRSSDAPAQPSSTGSSTLVNSPPPTVFMHIPPTRRHPSSSHSATPNSAPPTSYRLHSPSHSRSRSSSHASRSPAPPPSPIAPSHAVVRYAYPGPGPMPLNFPLPSPLPSPVSSFVVTVNSPNPISGPGSYPAANAYANGDVYGGSVIVRSGSLQVIVASPPPPGSGSGSASGSGVGSGSRLLVRGPRSRLGSGSVVPASGSRMVYR